MFSHRVRCPSILDTRKVGGCKFAGAKKDETGNSRMRNI